MAASTERIKLKLSILGGKDVVVRDRGLLPSNPYVEVWVGHAKIGQTFTKCNSNNPVWKKDENNTFEIKLDVVESEEPEVILKLWDEDEHSDPNSIGTVALKISTTKDDTTNWINITPDSPCNVKGMLKIRMKTSPKIRGGGSIGSAGTKSRKSKMDNEKKSKKSISPKDSKRSKSKSKSSSKKRMKSKSPTTITRKSKSPKKSSSAINGKKKKVQQQSCGQCIVEESSPMKQELPLRFNDDHSINDDLPPLQVYDELKIHPVKKNLVRNSWNSSSVQLLANHTIERLETEIEYLKEELVATKPFKSHRNRKNSIVEVVEFLQEEYQRLDKQRTESQNRAMTNQTSRKKVVAKMTILRGTNLVSKKEDLCFLEEDASNPYVEVWRESEFIGQTDFKVHTVEPIWNERFDIELNRYNSQLTLKVFDKYHHEFGLSKPSSPDSCMGVVVVDVPSEDGETVQWYDVPKSSVGDNEDAPSSSSSGKLAIKFEIAKVEDPRDVTAQLEQEVQRLKNEIEMAEQLSKLPRLHKALGRNSLSPTMDYLTSKNKELMKELYRIEGAMSA